MPGMDYVVRFLDASAAAVREQVVSARTAGEAKAQLESAGGVVLSVTTSWRSVLNQRVKRPLSSSEVATICREIRALVAAGLSVVEALEALATARDGDKGPSIHARLLEQLRAGRSLSNAMERVSGFLLLLVASVRSSERTSNLIEALDAYLRYDDMISALRRRLVSASLYPGIVVSLGLLICAFLLWVVVPRFAALYGQVAGSAGTATHLLLRGSLFLKEHPGWVGSLLLVLILATAVFFSRGGGRRLCDRLADAWPWLGAQLAHFERARIYEALALLVKCGFSLHESLALCGELARGEKGRRRIDLARTRIESGVNVTTAFFEAGLTDSVTARLLRASERGGDFDRVLRAIALRHSQAFEAFVDRATRIVEPLLLLGVALLVGSMVVLLYMPIFDISASIR